MFQEGHFRKIYNRDSSLSMIMTSLRKICLGASSTFYVSVTIMIKALLEHVCSRRAKTEKSINTYIGQIYVEYM